MPTTPATVSKRAVSRKPNDLPTDDTRRRGNGGLTHKVRAAIDAQVFEGLRRKDAAQQAGIAEHTLYQALRKPSVLAYWNECLKVLRTGERARNIHRLTEIRDAADNMPAVNAIKELEAMADHDAATPRAAVTTPGIVIIVGSDAKPLTQQPNVTVIEGDKQP